MDEVDQRGSNDQHPAFDGAPAEASSGGPARDGGPPEGEWIGAAAACELLGVKRQTLYAYASRGLVRSAPGSGRERLYRREDLERLAARSAARAGHGAVAAGALRWGEPVLDTAISQIAPEGPRYRGRSAVALAREGARFETVAEWLWRGAWNEGARFAARSVGIDVRRAARLVPADAHPLERLMVGLALLAAADAGVVPDAAVLVRRFAAMLALAPGREASVERALAADTVAESVAIALGVRPTRRAVVAIDRALVLMADHELNASTFACRVAAGAGADLYACTIAALATLSGPAHGRSCDRIEAMLAEARAPEDAAAVIRDRRRRGDAVPGFGHPLYPHGDPRTPPLMESAVELAPRSAIVRKVRAFSAAMELAGGEKEAVDTGLVALAGALGTESGSAAALMAVGRLGGWIAHALEQRAAGYSLRPRARYSALATGEGTG